MDGFTGHSQDRTTYGFLDMGGAPTEVRLRLLGGEEIIHKVFATTWLGY